MDVLNMWYGCHIYSHVCARHPHCNRHGKREGYQEAEDAAVGDVWAFMSALCAPCFVNAAMPMVMRRYVRPNLSSTACTKIDSLFKTMAALFEALVLIALGLSRAANILPCAAIVNHLRHPHLRMPAKHQGAMAFALSVQASEDFGAAGEVMKASGPIICKRQWNIIYPSWLAYIWRRKS
ncbi:Na_H_Exchanger domain-containing protein [Haematococcus lacustris]|uniref:Na_H_Exchanger domain-containing protein n=1 Tax=Haematococcus lacustris TaxID=44745 RepID=A0A699YUJ0_HAELA|nr:Na_H_Exchanger domain-containing protein [Haematococcus lacustris]